MCNNVYNLCSLGDGSSWDSSTDFNAYSIFTYHSAHEVCSSLQDTQAVAPNQALAEINACVTSVMAKNMKGRSHTRVDDIWSPTEARPRVMNVAEASTLLQSIMHHKFV